MKELLNAAADRIEKHGHLKKCFGGEGFGYCAMGAILEEAQKRFDVYTGDVTRALCSYLKVPSVTFWNDAPERTKEEVVAALRGAASCL